MKKAAIGIIVTNDNKVLLIKRRDVPIWVIPGGGIEDGETPADAVTREVYEETGLTVEIVRKVAEYHPINKLSSLTHVFECRSIQGQPTVGPETGDIEFFSIDNFPNNLFPLHRDWINDAFQKFPYVIKRPLTKANYLQGSWYFIKHPIIGLRYILARLNR